MRASVEGPFTLQMERFPMARILSPSVASYDKVSIPSYFACLDEALARAQPFVIVHDARDMPHVDDGRRAEFVAMVDARRAQIERQVIAYAGIVSSPMERGLLTAFRWFLKLPLPIRLFTSDAEASAWLLTRHHVATRDPQGLARRPSEPRLERA